MSIARQEVSTDSFSTLGVELLNTPLHFSQITAATISELVKKIKILTDLAHEKIVNASQINFDNVVKPLIELSVYKKKAEKLCTFAANVHTDVSVREESRKATLDIKKIENQFYEETFKLQCQYRIQYYAQE